MDNKTILVIEDNALNMKLVRTLLSIGKFNILEASDAEHGIQLARENLPKLILMDIQLPGMDGLVATRLIKTDPTLKTIPILAIASRVRDGDHLKALEAGCDVILYCEPNFDNIAKAIDFLKAEVSKNLEFKNTVSEALQRIIKLKKNYLLPYNRVDITKISSVVGCEEHKTVLQNFVNQIYQGLWHGEKHPAVTNR